MPLSLEIVPTTDVLTMYGSQDTELVDRFFHLSAATDRALSIIVPRIRFLARSSSL